MFVPNHDSLNLKCLLIVLSGRDVLDLGRWVVAYPPMVT